MTTTPDQITALWSRIAPDIEIAARPTLERALLQIQLAERLEDMAGIIEGKDF